MKFYLALLVLALWSLGCAPWCTRLSFPRNPSREKSNETWYDVNRDGKPDFVVRADGVGYDDDEDGRIDRFYRFADFPNTDVPHAVILLDSLPFEVVKERWNRGDFQFFDRPVKVIPVFPSLTELCYTRVLDAPPLVGMTEEYYDPAKGKIHAGYWERATGYRQPWERLLAYNAHYMEASFTYLDPRDWLPVEMERMRRAIDESADRVTVVYAVSASGMACKYGRAGMEETLDAAKQLCLQLLYEHHGAIKITMMADHGHTLVESRSASKSLEKAMKDHGFLLTKSIKSDRDVVIELAALVNYVGLRTKKAAALADAIVSANEVQFAAYLSGESVIVRDAAGSAAIDYRNGAYRYRIIDHDVLGYGQILEKLKKKMDSFATDRDWFSATVDARYPDGPKRFWDAFHTLVVNPPDVMVTLKDGWYVGKSSLEKFIQMKSTHGGLDQQNSATFVMTMTGRANEPMRGEDVMKVVEPEFFGRISGKP